MVITSASGAAVRLVALHHAGQAESPTSSKVIGHALDRFIGTWSAEQEVELLKAIEVFEQRVRLDVSLLLDKTGWTRREC